jgi:hypothetical protein
VSSRDPLADYPAPAADEAVAPDGGLRDTYAALGPVLREWGPAGLTAAAEALAAGRPLPEAVRWAVAAAALSTTATGARGALPDPAAVAGALSATPAAVPGR